MIAGLSADAAHRRWEAAALLGKDPQRSPEAIAALVMALADPEPLVRWQAVEALAAQEAGRVFPTLVAALADPEPLRRVAAAEALGRMGGEAAALILSRYVGDPVSHVRAAVAGALGQTCDLTCVPVLRPLLADPDPDVRRAVAGALGRIGDPAAAGALAEALSREGQPLLVRRALAAALARAPHPDTQPVLLAALADPDPQVRGYAAQALGQIGNEAAYAALAAIQADESPLLRDTVGEQARQALRLLERRGRRGPAVGQPLGARG
jgi:HEAT repeat protein